MLYYSNLYDILNSGVCILSFTLTINFPILLSIHWKAEKRMAGWDKMEIGHTMDYVSKWNVFEGNCILHNNNRTNNFRR